MPFRLGPMELIIVLVIVMVIFGVGRLPDIGSAMGKAIREFRKSQSESIVDESAEKLTESASTDAEEKEKTIA